jgi:hypothetical protein
VPATGSNPQYNKKSIILKKEFDWLLSEDFQKLREGFEPVDNREFMDEDKHERAEESAFGEDPSKGKTTPYTNDNIFSPEQVSTFWLKCGELDDAERRLNPGMEVDKTSRCISI